MLPGLFLKKIPFKYHKYPKKSHLLRRERGRRVKPIQAQRKNSILESDDVLCLEVGWGERETISGANSTLEIHFFYWFSFETHENSCLPSLGFLLLTFLCSLLSFSQKYRSWNHPRCLGSPTILFSLL